MAKYRFNVRYFTKRAYDAYFGMKLGVWARLGTPQGVQTLYKNAALLDPRQSQFDAVWGFGHPTRCANIVQKCCAFGPKAKSVRCGLGFWAPHKVCKHCTKMLRFWTQGKVSSMRFGVLGTPQGVQTLYKNAALLDPRQSQFDAVRERIIRGVL